MASRENQGLHIALILLVMLTVGLCVTSYVFYSKAATRLGEAEAAKTALTTAQDERDSALFKAQTLTYMITGGAKTWNQVEEDLANIPGGGADDSTMEQVRKSFQDNMMLYGAAEEEHESARNYESLPTFLLSRVRDLNQQLTDLRRSENQLTADKNQFEQAEKDRTKKYEEGEQTARDELATEREKFRQDRTTLEKAKDDLASQLTGKDNTILDLRGQLDDQRQDFTKQINNLTTIVDDQKMRLKQYLQKSFEVPDATITSVNQRESVCYIDVGSGDNLNKQQTFSVYDKGTTGVVEAKPKGRIEVVQILGEHVAMCRILEDEISNIILPGDLVFTPAWSPGRSIHFAVAGFVDIMGDGKHDLDLLKNLIKVNGGVYDEEVVVATRYLIQGEDRGASIDGEPTGDERADFTNKVRMAEQIGVDRLTVDKLLSLMGWKADVRAISLGRGGSSGEVPKGEDTSDENNSPFRKRSPTSGF